MTASVRNLSMSSVSTSDIITLLKSKYSKDEWALAFEVSSGSRYADMVAMNLWPSRGLAIHGFEIKAYRNDWKKELKTPAKAEAVARYCDYWWLVANEGIVKDDELPDTWGLIEVKNNALSTTKKASKKENVKPIDRNFMASLFRRLSCSNQAEAHALAKAMIAEAENTMTERVNYAVDQRTRKATEIQQKMDKINQLIGIDLSHWACMPEEFAKAVKFVMGSGVFDSYGSIYNLRSALKSMNKKFDEVYANFEDATNAIK